MLDGGDARDGELLNTACNADEGEQDLDEFGYGARHSFLNMATYVGQLEVHEEERGGRHLRFGMATGDIKLVICCEMERDSSLKEICAI